MAGLTCPKCDGPVESSDRFCEACGESLLLRRTPIGGPLGAAGGCRSCGGAVFDTDGFCENCGHRRPSGRDRMECDLGVVAGVSDRGLRRARNEDSMAFGAVGRTGSTRAVVAIVCDGVASSERADEASQAASDAAVEVLLVALMDEDSFPSDATNDAVRAAFAAVDALVRPNESPSCTYVSAVVADGKVTVGWLGDSRAYWIGDDSAAQQLTIDDTVVSLLVAAGVNAEQAMADPNAHALARWVGSDAEDREPQVRTFRPEGPGAIVLCSDGLWNYRPSLDTFEAAVRTGAATPGTRSAASTAEALTTLALDSGGHDNVTVVVVPIPFTDQHGSPSA